MIQIEDLEGYKRAKDVYMAQLKLGLSPYDYEEALLQYRRENNIFEVGDKVLLPTDISDEVVVVTQVDLDQDYIRDFKHATKEEILANKRLSV